VRAAITRRLARSLAPLLFSAFLRTFASLRETRAGPLSPRLIRTGRTARRSRAGRPRAGRAPGRVGPDGSEPGQSALRASFRDEAVVSHDRQMCHAHLRWLIRAVEQDGPFGRGDTGILGADALMRAPGGLVHLVERPGHVRHSPGRFRLFPGGVLRNQRHPSMIMEASGDLRKIGRVATRLFTGRILVSRREPSGGAVV
jgi:hypothetical protein